MLPTYQWFEVVERTPLVSIDLIITDAQGKVLLGWRNNKPAQHCWFVPGGVVRKGETLQQANFAGIEGVGTHYVVLAHRLNAEQHLPGLVGVQNLPKAQHKEYVWMPVAELLNNPQVHKYTKAYFQVQL